MQAADFVARIGVDRLAIAVGNIHGISLDEPVLDLPETREPLYVSKPIGNYEPIKEEANKHFRPDPN